MSLLLAGLVLSAIGGLAGDRASADRASEEAFFAQVLDHQFNLEYDVARGQLLEWLHQYPADVRALNYLGTVLLHREMFRRGILETRIYGELGEMFQTRKMPFSAGFQGELFEVLQKAQVLAENRLKQNPNDSEALYWAGITHATRAVFYFTMAKSYLAALRESTEARKAHAQVLKINPNFVDAWLVVGVNDYVVGVLPWYLKMLASLAGYRGNRAQGIEEVKRVIEPGSLAREDAKFILAILYRRQKMYPEALQVLQSLAESYPRNFLLQREVAEIFEIKGDWQAAAKVYDGLVAKVDAHGADPDLMPVAKILYEAGQIQTRLGDSDRALKYFERAGGVRGDDIYIYRAELAAADLYLRSNRRNDALRMYRRIAATVPNTDEGKAARRVLKKLQAGCGPSVAGSS